MRFRSRTPLAAFALGATLAACTAHQDTSGDSAASVSETALDASSETLDTELYSIPLQALDGTPVRLSDYSDRALLIVNVASECGLTPQYAGLQALQQEYEGRGLTVMGVPCNQFGGQEPGSADEIRAFCTDNYEVSFPLLAKTNVNAPERHPLYELLTQVPDAAGKAGDVQWNFEKFVVSAGGDRIARFRPRTAPDDPELIRAVEAALPPQ